MNNKTKENILAKASKGTMCTNMIRQGLTNKEETKEILDLIYVLFVDIHKLTKGDMTNESKL